MSINAILFGMVAGVLSFIFAGGLTELMLTNILLGFIAGALIDRRKK